jgi:hypothetical protein
MQRQQKTNEEYRRSQLTAEEKQLEDFYCIAKGLS